MHTQSRQRPRAAYALGQLRRACGADGSMAAEQFAELLDIVAEKGCDLDVKPIVWPMLLGALPPWTSSAQQQALKEDLGGRYAQLLQDCQDKEQRLLRLVMCRDTHTGIAGQQTPAHTTPLAVTVEQGGPGSYNGGDTASTAGVSPGAATDMLLPDTDSLLHELQGPDDEDAFEESSVDMTPRPSVGARSSMLAGIGPILVSTPSMSRTGHEKEDSPENGDKATLLSSRQSRLVSPLVSVHSTLATSGQRPPGTPGSGKRARGFRSCHEYSYSLPVFPSPEKLLRPHLRSSSVGQSDAHLEQAGIVLEEGMSERAAVGLPVESYMPTSTPQTQQGSGADRDIEAPGNVQTPSASERLSVSKQHQRGSSRHFGPGRSPLPPTLPVINSNVDSDSCRTTPCGTPRTPGPLLGETPPGPSPDDLPSEAPYTDSPPVPRTQDPPRHAARIIAAGQTASRIGQMPKTSHEWHGALVSEAAGTAAQVPDALRQFWEAQRLIVVDCVRTDFLKNSLTTADALSGWLSAALADNKLYQKYQAAGQQAWTQVTWLSSLARTALEHATHFSGEHKRQVVRLIHLLSAYSVHDPDVGYCQGMSDLALPFLLVMEDDGMAFWCFERLMAKVRRNFTADDHGILEQLTVLSQLLQQHDPFIHQRLHQLGAMDCHFAYRMIVVLLRRELPLEQVLRLWEMLWADDLLSAYPEYQAMLVHAQQHNNRPTMGFLSQPGGFHHGTLPLLQFSTDPDAAASSGAASPTAAGRAQLEQPHLRLSSFFKSRWGLGVADVTPSKSEGGWRDADQTPCSHGVRQSLPMLLHGASTSHTTASAREGQSESSMPKRDGASWLSAKFKGLRDSLTTGGATAMTATDSNTRVDGASQLASAAGAITAAGEVAASSAASTHAVDSMQNAAAVGTAGSIMPLSAQQQRVCDTSQGGSQTKPGLGLSLDALLKRSQPGSSTSVAAQAGTNMGAMQKSAMAACSAEPAPTAEPPAEQAAGEPASRTESCCSVVVLQSADDSSHLYNDSNDTPMMASGGSDSAIAQDLSTAQTDLASTVRPQAQVHAEGATAPQPQAPPAAGLGRASQSATSGLLSRFANFASSKGLGLKSDSPVLPPQHPSTHPEQHFAGKWGSRLHVSFNISSSNDAGAAQPQVQRTPDACKRPVAFNAAEVWGKAARHVTAAAADDTKLGAGNTSQSGLKSTVSAPVCSSKSGSLVLNLSATSSGSHAGVAGIAAGTGSHAGVAGIAAGTGSHAGAADAAGTAAQATGSEHMVICDQQGPIIPDSHAQSALSAVPGTSGDSRMVVGDVSGKATDAADHVASGVDQAAVLASVVNTGEPAACAAGEEKTGFIHRLFSKQPSKQAAASQSEADVQGVHSTSLKTVADRSDTVVPEDATAQPSLLRSMLNSIRGSSDGSKLPDDQQVASDAADSTISTRPDKPWSLQRLMSNSKATAPPSTSEPSAAAEVASSKGHSNHRTAGIEDVAVTASMVTVVNEAERPSALLPRLFGLATSALTSGTQAAAAAAAAPEPVPVTNAAASTSAHSLQSAAVEPSLGAVAPAAAAVAGDTEEKQRGMFSLLSRLGQKQEGETAKSADPLQSGAASISMDGAAPGRLMAGITALFGRKDAGTAAAPAASTAAAAVVGAAASTGTTACQRPKPVAASVQQASSHVNTTDAEPLAAGVITEPQQAPPQVNSSSVAEPLSGITSEPGVSGSTQATVPPQDAVAQFPGSCQQGDVLVADPEQHASEEDVQSVVVLNAHSDQLSEEDSDVFVQQASEEQEAQSGHILAGWVAHWAAAPSLDLLLYFIAAVVAVAGRRQLLDGCHDADDVHQLFRNPAVLKIDVSECARLARQYRQATAGQKPQQESVQPAQPDHPKQPCIDDDTGTGTAQDTAVSNVPQHASEPAVDSNASAC